MIEKDELGCLKESDVIMMESKVLNNTGSIPGDKKRYDQALEMYDQSLKIAKEHETQFVIGRTLNNIAMIYQNNGDYYQALEHGYQSLMIAK
ncbi:MAG TPA: tetratricopeptide repeat protein [Candidatus Nitrosocosmicus sp.]